MTLLDAFTDILDAETLGRLGDPILYRRLADYANPLGINAFVDHSDRIEGLGGGSVVSADVSISVRKTDVPQPLRDDVIELPRRGEKRKVLTALLDPSGRWWVLSTKAFC